MGQAGQRRARTGAIAAAAGATAAQRLLEGEPLSAFPRLPAPGTAQVNNAGLALGVAGVDENDLGDCTTMIETNITAVRYRSGAL